MASSEPPRPIDRATLVKTVTGLSASDLARVVTSVEGAAAHIGRHGTVSEQAADLIRWAESSTGPGLEAIQGALANFRQARIRAPHSSCRLPETTTLSVAATISTGSTPCSGRDGRSD
jgi:hypothetical protein